MTEQRMTHEYYDQYDQPDEKDMKVLGLSRFFDDFSFPSFIWKEWVAITGNEIPEDPCVLRKDPIKGDVIVYNCHDGKEKKLCDNGNNKVFNE
jgi:hypothetical protein